jgi:hypothetical protein
METDEIFWPARGTCGLNTGDVGLIDEGYSAVRAAGGPVALRIF